MLIKELPARIARVLFGSTRDVVVRVDRLVRPAYPEWVAKVVHPELEGKGPPEYRLASLRLCLCGHQQDGGWVKGHDIYDYLVSNELLADCLSLRDGEEIKKKGIEVFREFFFGKAVFLWASVAQFHNGTLGVPFLAEHDGEVMVRWRALEGDWLSLSPAARFP